MKDPRYTQLAKTLVNYSIDVQPGEKVHIHSSDDEVALTRELVRAVYEAGGLPFLTLRNTKLQVALLKGLSQEQIDIMAAHDLNLFKQMDAFLHVTHTRNTAEQRSIPQEKMGMWAKFYGRTINEVVLSKKWCGLRAPGEALAQDAGMSTEEFEDFYFDVCTLDYAKMSKAMEPLVELMEKTDRVHIKGPGTDLTFSIKGIPAVKCDGKYNVPDGEVFTAPVRDSVNGTVQFNTPTPYLGFVYDNVRLTFQDGKIIEAVANDTERINKVFDLDEGARYIGEFAIGFHPHILKPMKDILFDEKIAGSFHFTPGRAYEVADNGNKSQIHWDLVCIQRPEYGGGEIWFDDVLIRKDGIFVLPELQGLNPENLK